MNDDYEEPVVIDEDELDEEVLREMMDEDDREGEELWKRYPDVMIHIKKKVTVKMPGRRQERRTTWQKKLRQMR